MSESRQDKQNFLQSWGKQRKRLETEVDREKFSLAEEGIFQLTS